MARSSSTAPLRSRIHRSRPLPLSNSFHLQSGDGPYIYPGVTLFFHSTERNRSKRVRIHSAGVAYYASPELHSQTWADRQSCAKIRTTKLVFDVLEALAFFVKRFGSIGRATLSDITLLSFCLIYHALTMAEFWASTMRMESMSDIQMGTFVKSNTEGIRPRQSASIEKCKL